AHGTHVAGLVGAATNNGVGVAGQDWACKLMALKVFPEVGGTTDAVILAAMDYALAMGAHVINLSLRGPYNSVYETPLQAARSRGRVVVAAAGNENAMLADDPLSWLSPVCNDGPNPTVDNLVLGVAATDAEDRKAWFSNYDGSSTRTFVDVSAPGDEVLSCFIFDPANGFNTAYGEMSGTSMACPIVAGLCALLRAQYPSYPPLAIINQIRSTADNIDSVNPGYEGMLGAGRINDRAALAVALPPGPPRRVLAVDTAGDEGGSITVTWGKSLDDGRGRNIVRDYVVQRCGNQKNEYGVDEPDGNWEDLTTLPAGSTSYVDAPVPDFTPYWYRVAARDNRGNASYSQPSGPAEARDDLPPPAIGEYLSASDTPSDEGGSISLDWSGYTPPSDFKTYRVYRTTSSFSSVSQAQLIYPTAADPDLTATSYQDQTVVDGTKYYYAVTAVDDAGNELKTVTPVGPVMSQPNFVLTLPSGVSMFSIGVQTTEDDIAALLGVAPQDIKLAVWNPATNDYVKSWVTPGDPALRHRLGRAFFIRLPSALAKEIGGQPATSDFDVTLRIGWNMVGNPFLHDFRWDQVTVKTATGMYSILEASNAGVMGDFAWYWDTPSRSYRLVSARPDAGEKIIRQSQGFWVLARQPCTITLPSALPASAPGDAGRSDVDWKMRLVARCGEYADVDNYLGVSANPASLNGIVSPPGLGQGVELSFVNPGVDGPAAASFVGRGARQVWAARVAVTGMAGQEVEISWPDLSALPSSVRPVLADKTSGKRVYMRTTAFYRFTPSEGETVREFEISAAGGGTLQIGALSARAAGGGVEIAFTLSSPAEVSADVLNVAGRVVARLRPVAMASGACSLRWNGLSSSGARVPRGMYLLRLRARSADGQESNAVTQARLAH
ncbi:MAG: S8 family serine peptidase, partial [Armatimonadetes bacterium]|nr:S8 family serine peptidase [Armatimonadota bacterium]